MAAQADERTMISLEQRMPQKLRTVDENTKVVSHWRIRLGVLCGVSILAAVAIYAISEYLHHREQPAPTMTPA